MRPRSRSGARLAACGTLLLAAACGTETTSPTPTPRVSEPLLAKSATAGEGVATSGYLDEVNRKLATKGLRYAVARAEVIRAANPNAATIVFANDRTKRLTSHWVANDARRGAAGSTLSYLVFSPFRFANGSIDAEPAIDRSFATWNAVKCSKLSIVKRADTGLFPSFVLGGTPFLADIVELGFLPGYLFDLVLGPGSSTSVLGVTFTFVFGSYDANGNFTPSDVNRDGKDDTAIKEVWYNDDFAWSTTGTGGAIDIETVALHENGHALELGHFGKVTLNTSNGKLKASPRAVMNAFVLGTLRAPLGTDNGGYCGNWASWPK
jgi:hypothetical protein